MSKNAEQEQHDPSHEAKDTSASDVTIHILNGSPQTIKEITKVIKKKYYACPK
jgi:hypothetical protein